MLFVVAQYFRTSAQVELLRAQKDLAANLNVDIIKDTADETQNLERCFASFNKEAIALNADCSLPLLIN